MRAHMRIGTKILLLMLLMTVGSATIVSWIVTVSVTRYETQRANDQISFAIRRYVQGLNEHYQQVNHVVQVMLGDPALRSLLSATDDAGHSADSAREQLKQEVFGHDVQLEVQAIDGKPVFHVLINLNHDLVMVTLPHDGTVPAKSDSGLVKELTTSAPRWPIDAVIDSKSKPVMKYLAINSELFLVMGVPLYEELNQSPTHAYFVGFRIDDSWIHRQLLAETDSGESTLAPLDAAVLLDHAVVARGTNDPQENRFQSFSADTALSTSLGGDVATAGSQPVGFTIDGEHFVGQSITLLSGEGTAGKLVLASSLDRALIPLHKLQRSIFWTALVACGLAVFACRAIAGMISRPIQELVAGTRRIAAGEFDAPVHIHRRDELGLLADSFNQMSQGLKERDSLLGEKIKIERDMALARKIQMDVLPSKLPTCPGYDMAAFSQPAEQTGGDIYDLVAVALDDPETPGAPVSLALLLADATGHGIGPALSVTQVRAMLRIGVRLRAGLDNVFAQINRQLCQDLGSDRFVTAFLGLLDPARHVIDYQSAGQGPLLHFHARNHRFEWLNSSMPPLGIEEDPESDGSLRMDLEPGDLIVLLTDGFFERQNPEQDLFGRETIAEIILQHHHRPSRELLNLLLQATEQFSRGSPQQDDMTALIIRRLEPAE